MTMLDILCVSVFFVFFFFNDTATTEIYTLSLHDALPIFGPARVPCPPPMSTIDRFRQLLEQAFPDAAELVVEDRDRKSTRLNSSHDQISYAVFCLKKKKQAISCKYTTNGVQNGVPHSPSY